MSSNDLTAKELAAFILNQDKSLPKYDKWEPFLTALIEQKHDVGVSAVREPRRGPRLPGIPEPDDPGEYYDYLNYIPAWTDPDWKPDREVVYPDYAFVTKPQRDVMTHLRPALLPGDTVRNPTPHALRFGIFPDRSDGRSRLSPTNAVSRKILPALQAQFDRVPEADQAALAGETARRASRAVLEHGGRQAVALDVFEEYKAGRGMASVAQLINDDPVVRGDPSLQMLDAEVPPEARDYVRRVAQLLEDDRDWQRMLLNGWTTDELIAQDVHTMADIEGDLDVKRPIHKWLRKETWEDASDRGTDPTNARFVYSFGGKREEYDVHHNDRLWEALQPALQVVTRVIETRPVLYQALMDFRTRQPFSDPAYKGVTLTRMVAMDEIDDRLCWPRIQELTEMGYNSVADVEAMMDVYLRFRIGSVSLDNSGTPTGTAWGRTSVTDESPVIVMTIGAEMVWPLLVPQYSSSEKMSASFAIAATILHELAHAISYASELTCQLGSDSTADARTRKITTLLNALHNDMFREERGEPWYRDYHYSEVGFNFEEEFFGQTISPLVEQLGTRLMGNHAIALYGYRHSSTGERVGGKRSQMRFSWPISIRWYHRFFQTRFWEETVPRWGLDVVKHLPLDVPILAVARYAWFDHDEVQSIFGHENFVFIQYVQTLLRRYDMTVLFMHCFAVFEDVRGDVETRARWNREAQVWNKTDWSKHPIIVTMRELQDLATTGEVVLSAARVGSVEEARKQLSAALPSAAHVSTAAWPGYIGPLLQEYWNVDGGRVIRPVVMLYTLLRRGMTDYQVFIQQYFSAPLKLRKSLYRAPEKAFDPQSAKNEPFACVMEFFNMYRQASTTVAEAVRSAAERVFVLGGDRDFWLGWGNRFQQISDMAGAIVDAVAADTAADRKGLSEAECQAILSQLSVASIGQKRRAQVFEKAAERELTVVDPRIRETVLEYHRRVQHIADTFPKDAQYLHRDFGDIAVEFPARVKKVITGLRHIPLGEPRGASSSGGGRGGTTAPTSRPPLAPRPSNVRQHPAQRPSPGKAAEAEHRRGRKLAVRTRRRSGERAEGGSRSPSGSRSGSGTVVLHHLFAMRKHAVTEHMQQRARKRVGSVSNSKSGKSFEHALQRAFGGAASFAEVAEAAAASGADLRSTNFADLPPPSTLPPGVGTAHPPPIFPNPFGTSGMMTNHLEESSGYTITTPDAQTSLVKLEADPLSLVYREQPESIPSSQESS